MIKQSADDHFLKNYIRYFFFCGHAGFVCPSVGPSVCRSFQGNQVESGETSVLDVYVSVWGVDGGWMPVRNNIVTPRHFLTYSFKFWLIWFLWEGLPTKDAILCEIRDFLFS